MNQNNQQGLIIAIVFAALAISGSFVFLGYQMGGSGFLASISNGGDTQVEEIKKLKDEIAALKSGKAAPTPVYDPEELVDDDAFLGDEDAVVTIVEFSDYQCPFCRRHYTNTLPQIKENYVETGKVRYAFRDFPLSFHADAVPAAAAAECARKQQGDGMYFRMHGKIFEGSSSGSISATTLSTYAKELGLNMTNFDECMADPAIQDEINADMAQGSSFGISGTPGFVISNGKTSKVISGAQSYNVFKAEIDRQLK